jgi:hypothetical protein
MIELKILICIIFFWSSDLIFLLFMADFPPYWIRIANADPDPEAHRMRISNADPDSDPEHCI